MSGAFAELHCHSNFSFLDGASGGEDLVERAVELGLTGLALTDHQGADRALAGQADLAPAAVDKKPGLEKAMAGHIIAQVAAWQGRQVFAFTRPGDSEKQEFARKLGAERFIVNTGNPEDLVNVIREVLEARKRSALCTISKLVMTSCHTN